MFSQSYSHCTMTSLDQNPQHKHISHHNINHLLTPPTGFLNLKIDTIMTVLSTAQSLFYFKNSSRICSPYVGLWYAHRNPGGMSTAHSMCLFEPFLERLFITVKSLHRLGCCGEDKFVCCLIGFCEVCLDGLEFV